MRYSKRLKKPQPQLVTIGIDASIRGTALAIVRNGELIGSFAWTEVKTLQKKHPDKLIWYSTLKNPTEADLEQRKSLIATWVRMIVMAFRYDPIDSRVMLPVVALEDYAFSKRSGSVSDLHELGGWIKSMLWRDGIPYRTYDPMSIKLAWAGNGHASKDEMVDACVEHFGVDYSELVQEVKRKKKPKKKNTPKGKGPGYDLADATCIAFLAYRELSVKLGKCTLEKLTPNLRRVMLRTTKANPEALASRPFIHVSDLTDSSNVPIRASGEPK